MLRFVPAISVSAALVLAGPVIGQIRSTLQSAFPGQYQWILIAVVGVCAAVATAGVLLRMRDRRVTRLAALASALAIAISYSLLARTGDAAVDAVERFHFVEYGVITLLFYRAWRPVPDASRLLLPVLAGLIVGTVEEWMQWFVPARVGEVRDVFLNLWAIVSGLLFSVALDPPAAPGWTMPSTSRRRLRRVAAAAVIVFALFFHFAHLGYAIDDADAGRFRSAYSAAELAAAARLRAERWRGAPPLTWTRYSREDQYFSEGVAWVRRRNHCWETADYACALRANTILERYYAPVIDTPSYVSASGLRWPAEQRADAARRTSAAPHPGAAMPPDETVVYTWEKPLYWLVVAAVVAALLFV